MLLLGALCCSLLWGLVSAQHLTKRRIAAIFERLDSDSEVDRQLALDISVLTSAARTKRQLSDEDCGENCSNLICDSHQTGLCRCHDYYARRGDKCVPCDCGDKINCGFLSGFKFCNCGKYLSVESRCDECVCREKEFCYLRQVVAQCDCTAPKNETDPLCSACSCSNKNLFCTYLEKKASCHCTPPFALNKEGKCEMCVCPGENVECSFEDGLKKCSCKEGFVEQNRTCVECYCGDGHLCTMDLGVKACICRPNHVEHDGICKRCDCASNQLCKEKDNQFMCLCKEGYKEDQNGICRECFCGHGHSCELLPDGKKVCVCSENFQEHNGTCKECLCGGDFPCLFDNGEKTCLCNESFVQVDGTCQKVCHSGSCEHGICEGIGIKSYCRCDSGFAGPNCEQQVSSGSLVLIFSISVIAVLSSMLLVVFVRRKWRATGNKKESLKHNEESFINDATFHRQESLM